VAALDYLEISNLDDIPPDHIVPSAETLQTQTCEERKSFEVCQQSDCGKLHESSMSMNNMLVQIRMKVLIMIVMTVRMECIPTASV